MSQTYRSTRSASAGTSSFEEAVITGLAPDGGLFVPSVIPKLPENFVDEWSTKSFQELAFEIMRLYISDSEISSESLKELIEKSYSTFRDSNITPLRTLKECPNVHILELFHGPTYAFKDVALQFVGNLFEFFLKRKNLNVKEGETRHHITVVGATSGDTGSAAIYGLRNKKDVSVFILYPTGRISPIQEEQMTTVEDANVHTLSVKGYFDDCQTIVKEIFGDSEFNSKYHVGAINSINWARILAQITYYFHAYFQLKKQSPKGKDLKVKFVVPSGNFGDILAGYFAKQMGLPVEKLVIATNENDILYRFIKTGRYEKEGTEVKSTYSPAMDILISSNFERLLWYLVRDHEQGDADLKAGAILADWMAKVKKGEPICVAPEVLLSALVEFDSERVSNEETIDEIKRVYQLTGEEYVVDPHTAIGTRGTKNQMIRDGGDGIEYISLSTAHPAKFAEAVNKALDGFSNYSFETDVLPEELKALGSKQKRITLVPEANVELVKQIIAAQLAKE